jgi:predicted lipoprotein with Yx(FWY)xxD motif
VALRPVLKLRAAAAVVALAACGGLISACGHSSAAAAPAYEVRAGTVPGLGRIVTDGQGLTLYMYVPDHQGPSRCSGLCADDWPPLLLPRGVTRPKAGPGIRAGLLGTVRRSNGRLQVTYGKWPLYRWQGDGRPGVATGQAADMGTWYALSVTGTVNRGSPT